MPIVCVQWSFATLNSKINKKIHGAHIIYVQIVVIYWVGRAKI